jgi:hypothetical protein
MNGKTMGKPSIVRALIAKAIYITLFARRALITHM